VLRNTVMLSSVAAAATAGVVTSGIASSPVALGSVSKRLADVQAADSQASLDDTIQARRASTPISRSSERGDETQRADEPKPQSAKKEKKEVEYTDPRAIGRALLPEFGFSADQFACLDALYVSESDWRVDADNPTSSAYGIPQALTSMHELPRGYMTDAEVQIRWGLGYIQDSYGSPCSAWEFKQANNYY
jgi:hypothetical protein